MDSLYKQRDVAKTKVKRSMKTPRKVRTESPAIRKKTIAFVWKKFSAKDRHDKERQSSLPPPESLADQISSASSMDSSIVVSKQDPKRSMLTRSSSVENESSSSSKFSESVGLTTRKRAPTPFASDDDAVEVDCLTFLTTMRNSLIQWNSRRGYSCCMDCYEVLKSCSFEPEKCHMQKAFENCRFIGSNVDRMQPSGSVIQDQKTWLAGMRRREGKMCQEERRAWFPSEEENSTSPTKDLVDTAKYSLPSVASSLLLILKQENKWITLNDPLSILHKSLPKSTRELCDVCRTSIFNFHWMCRYCAFIVCGSCDDEKKRKVEVRPFANGLPKIDTVPSKNQSHIPRDHLSWQRCCVNSNLELPEKDDRLSSSHLLQPAMMIPVGAYYRMEKQITEKSVCGQLTKKVLPVGVYDEFDDEVSKIILNGVPYFFEPPKEDSDASYSAFRDAWTKRMPIVVARVDRKMTDSLWSPEVFAEKFGDEDVTLVDCLSRPQIELKGFQHRDFWVGFKNFDERIKNEGGKNRLLKIKDWPQHASFAEKLPDNFTDLMKALPFNKYSNVKGEYNMVTYLQHFFNPPDLGPKMYIAYGSAGQPKCATTNLHVDISDAVNVIVYVGRPHGTGSDEVLDAAVKEIEKLNLNEEMMSRVRTMETPGALWQIYHPRDVDKIRKFIREIWRERGEDDRKADPIHSQVEFLDFELRRRLKETYGVQAYDILQFEGDAIFVPAGAPHQVWNIHSCIKVAEDFVSPEHVQYCVELAEQFRRLPDEFENKQDKLQIKNIIFHAAAKFLDILGEESSSN